MFRILLGSALCVTTGLWPVSAASLDALSINGAVRLAFTAEGPVLSVFSSRADAKEFGQRTTGNAARRNTEASRRDALAESQTFIRPSRNLN